jgi:hypothetical protein
MITNDPPWLQVLALLDPVWSDQPVGGVKVYREQTMFKLYGVSHHELTFTEKDENEVSCGQTPRAAYT